MILSKTKSQHEEEEQAYSLAPKLYRLAFARLNSREDVEDVVQETYFKAFSGISKFRKGTNMESWLTTILLNTIRDHVRKISRHQAALSLDQLAEDAELLPASLIDAENPESLLETEEISQELTQALRELPEFFLT